MPFQLQKETDYGRAFQNNYSTEFLCRPHCTVGTAKHPCILSNLQGASVYMLFRNLCVFISLGWLEASRAVWAHKLLALLWCLMGHFFTSMEEEIFSLHWDRVWSCDFFEQQLLSSRNNTTEVQRVSLSLSLLCYCLETSMTGLPQEDEGKVDRHIEQRCSK